MRSNNWKKYIHSLIAKEISAFSRYYDRIIQWHALRHDSGDLLEAIDCGIKDKISGDENVPDLSKEKDKRSIILFNGTFNYCLDIQDLLGKLKSRLSRLSRIAIVAYNPYFRWLYWLATWLRLRGGDLPLTFMTNTDLANIAKLSGYDIVRIRPAVYFPFRLLGVGIAINWLLPTLPFIRNFCLVSIIVLRPIKEDSEKPSLSIVIPARNEMGNIESALQRIPDLGGARIEIIFVEGHSSDGTWEEIERVSRIYSSQFDVKIFQQNGVGKNDAVRLGFSHATGDLLTILDADLTMPPEMLGRFYDAYCAGLADFINGSRLVYPMEGNAMRFLNRLGNIFFAKALSSVLGTKIGDSLCGTKLISRNDYYRIVKWREDFGEFDPFGDYDLLFPAAILALGIIDIPIRYRARTYGDSNISRFSHGFMLLKMSIIGLLKVKAGRVR